MVKPLCEEHPNELAVYKEVTPPEWSGLLTRKQSDKPEPRGSNKGKSPALH